MAALGSAAQDKGLEVGQRVGIGWTARGLRHCDACISGNQISNCEGAVPAILCRGGFAEKLRGLAVGNSSSGEYRYGVHRARCYVAALRSFKPLLMPAILHRCQPRWRHRY